MNHLEKLFPNLQDKDYRITSKETSKYNCIAWSVGDSDREWWPRPDPRVPAYWPEDAPEQETMYAFKEAYRTLGFEVCQSQELEEGYEKVAIFSDEYGKPTHAARQLEGGKWTSKCGSLEDIAHELEGLEGDQYGSVACIMRRLRDEG